MTTDQLPALEPLGTATRTVLALSPYIGVAMIGAAVLWVVWWRRRLHRARSALAHRIRVDVVPTTKFDPSVQEVVRFGHHLARAHWAAGSVPVRGAAVRLRYTTAGGRMRCQLEGPAEAGAVLRMPGYVGVEIRSTRPEKAIEPVRFLTTPTEVHQ